MPLLDEDRTSDSRLETARKSLQRMVMEPAPASPAKSRGASPCCASPSRGPSSSRASRRLRFSASPHRRHRPDPPDPRERSTSSNVHRDVGHDFNIDVDGPETSDTFVPDSIGDEDVFNGKFFVRGKQVGARRRRVHARGTAVDLSLRCYQLVRRGSADRPMARRLLGPGPGRFAITGGTGAYRGAPWGSDGRLPARRRGRHVPLQDALTTEPGGAK